MRGGNFGASSGAEGAAGTGLDGGTRRGGGSGAASALADDEPITESSLAYTLDFGAIGVGSAVLARGGGFFDGGRVGGALEPVGDETVVVEGGFGGGAFDMIDGDGAGAAGAAGAAGGGLRVGGATGADSVRVGIGAAAAREGGANFLPAAGDGADGADGAGGAFERSSDGGLEPPFARGGGFGPLLGVEGVEAVAAGAEGGGRFVGGGAGDGGVGAAGGRAGGFVPLLKPPDDAPSASEESLGGSGGAELSITDVRDGGAAALDNRCPLSYSLGSAGASVGASAPLPPPPPPPLPSSKSAGFSQTDSCV